MKQLKHRCLGGVATLALFPLLAEAGGFALIENSASGMGNAFAGASAVAEDASTLAFNPAGMTRLKGSQLVVAGHYISPQAKFSDDGSVDGLGTPLQGSDGDAGVDAIVPNLYYVTELNDRWHMGLAMHAPFGMSTEYDDDWVGRYHALNSSLKVINFTPSVAYRHSDTFSAGLGVTAQYLDVTLSSAIDFGTLCLLQELGSVLPAGTCSAMSLTPQQSDGYAEITGNNLSYGFTAGLLFSPTPQQRIGLSYRSQVVQNVAGSADFSVPGMAAFLSASSGAFVDTDAKAKVTLPASASFSYWQQVSDNISLMADATWTNWGVFDELRIEYDNPNQPDSVTTEEWRDTWRYSLGMNYRHSDTLTLRTGVALDQSVISDERYRTPRIPDGERRWLSVGAKFKVSDETVINAAFSRLFVESLKVNNTLESSIPQLQAELNGSYNASINIFSLQLTRNF
ncbi:MAG: outer membrane protein transport protein [Chromatiales bacterium]|nr:outer membrane protein transport protein [Chromatiales bacterium]